MMQAANDPLIGHERAAKYRFVESIGAGGNAFVCKYLDKETRNIVAIKVRR
jgi:hypothetical protein